MYALYEGFKIKSYGALDLQRDPLATNICSSREGETSQNRGKLVLKCACIHTREKMTKK